jgi:hypothetical protein
MNKLKLPGVLKVRDYHEFYQAEDFFKQLGLKIRIQDLGVYCAEYVGIVYVGPKTNPKVKALIKRYKQLIKDEEEEITDGRTWPKKQYWPTHRNRY